MTRILRLLLIAAIALPIWQSAAAQEVVPTQTTPPKVFDIKGKEMVVGKQTVKEKTVITTGSATSVVPNQQAPSLRDFNSETKTQNARYTVADGRLALGAIAPVCGPFYSCYLGNTDLNQNYQQYRTRSQMIYPEDMLKAIEPGSKIKSLTFYVPDGILFGNTAGTSGQLTISIGNCTQSSFASDQLASFSGGSVSSTVTPKKGATEITVTFTNTLTYNGGNLLVDVAVTRSGTADPDDEITYFSGIFTNNNQSIVRYFYYSGYNYGNEFIRDSFLPKMTIEYSYQCETPVSGDKSFFQGKTYTWGDGQENDLSQTATDPDQIIAMLGKVYTDPTIPGNYNRGYDENGVLVGSNLLPFDVPYTAAGTLTYNNNTIGFDDAYGWGIPCDYIYGEGLSSPYNALDFELQYWYMNPEQYKPNQDGVTLLLLELQDDFTPTNVYKYQTDENGNLVLDENDKPIPVLDEQGNPEIILPATQFDESLTGYNLLREYISKTIKSARVITESKRTGSQSDFSAGTLFKIDCEKMNKFYLVAKGQLQWHANMLQTTSSKTGYSYLDFYSEPNYLKGYFTDPETSETTNFNEYCDRGLDDFYFLLGHMFEQFSPSMSQTGDEVTGAREDIYQDLINMESFGVVHDCPNVPLVGDGHHFMMYGPDSKSDDCQDVHDMMFFVPDYRMMNHEERGTERYSNTGIMNQEYFKYSPDHQPTMGMFVIKQYPITGEQINDQETYRLHLTWTSNLLKFLPGELGKYTLYRVITNPDGTKTYQQVGNFNPNTFEYYDDVPMQHNGQQVTYIVSGQDVDEFLDLQMSNEESFIIPGLDHAEQIRIALNSDYYFSRYDAAEQKNYYSNSLIANNTIGTNVKPAYIENGSQFKFWRATIDEQTGDVVTPDEPFVVAEVSEWDPTTGGTLTYKDWNDQADFSGKPYKHGYHANVETSTISIDTKNNQISTDDEVVFDGLKLYDNFSVDVKANTHPSQYVYYVTLETAVPFGLNQSLPSFATWQDDKIFVYFEVPYNDWYEVRAYAWDGDDMFAGAWAGTEMTWVGTHDGKNVYQWSIPPRDNGALPANVIFSWKDGYHNFHQTGNLDYSNGGYYTITDVNNNTGSLVATTSADNTSNQARSNTVSVPVYKTEMAMNPISAQNVEDDVTHQFPAATKFDVNARYSSRSEILGYYIYRWASDETPTIYESDGADASPQGQAGNQGEYYTVAMNTDFTGRTENFGANYADVTASFEDNYMINEATEGDTYTYAPVVELFAPVQAVELPSGADRTDYNTYGGPQQMTAGGKIEVTVESSATTGDNGYEWTMNGSTYVYYNTLLKVNVLDLPEGYEVAKVRAWRKVNATDFLGEQAPTANTPDYGYRTELDSNGEFMFSNYYTTNYDPEGYDIQKDGYIGGEEDVNHIMAGTFGGKKLENGEQVPMDFVVRIYFTKSGAKAGEQPYYIAEVTATDVLTSNIPTSITGVESYRNVVSEKYYNAAGIESDTPFKGVNIVVTRYSDGSTSTVKVLK